MPSLDARSAIADALPERQWTAVTFLRGRIREIEQPINARTCDLLTLSSLALRNNITATEERAVSF